MYQNENNEYVTVHRGTDEYGDYTEYRIYQENGWTRICRDYGDVQTETYKREV